MSNPLISIERLSKRFGDVLAVDNVSLSVQENEFVALLGPSGCGKTTLLRMLAGLELPTDGRITIDGINMSRVPPNKRPVNMVFQSYAVFPHMSVQQNVAYGLKVSGVPKAEIAQAVHGALQMVRLEQFGQRRPDQLSGGQRQRVALARALVKQPRVLLLDEPLSALDAKLREQMQFELTRLQQALGITFIVVTHDQQEALSMADRIAVMNEGRIAQLASPTDLYHHPQSRFVADFIGRINILDGILTLNSGTSVQFDLADFGTLEVPCPTAPKSDAVAAIRPEHVMVSTDRPSGNDTVLSTSATISQISFHGDSRLLFAQTPAGQTLCAKVAGDGAGLQSYETGRSVWLSVSALHCRILS